MERYVAYQRLIPVKVLWILCNFYMNSMYITWTKTGSDIASFTAGMQLLKYSCFMVCII